MHTFLCTVCNYNESHSIHPGMLGNSYWRLPELTHELGLAHAFTEITSDRRLHRPLIRRVCVHNSGEISPADAFGCRPHRYMPHIFTNEQAETSFGPEQLISPTCPRGHCR